MTEQTMNDIREAAGCLSSIPNRAGMSILASQKAIEQMAGGVKVVIDKGYSAEMVASDIRQLEIEQAHRVMLVGRKRNDGPVISPKAEPYYRQYAKRW